MMQKFTPIFLLPLLLAGCAEKPACPPVTPAWALGQIVWEDEHNTQEAASALVEGYLQRDIPVSGIIIDSPWETSYNDFHWDKDRYPDPEPMTTQFREKGVRTLLWLTGCLNNSESDEDCPVVKSANFDEAVAKGYTVNGGEERSWWKGKGAHVDFTNPEAVRWWYGQVDQALLPGVEGFKVDQGELSCGDSVLTSIGLLNNHQFRHYYYDAVYDYVTARRPDTGVILARPWSFQGEGRFSSIDKLSIGWCGDFTGDWDGLKFQIENIYRSAQEGYGATGTEVGGFMGASSSKAQLIRYAQFGALTACMVNGGYNGPFTGHLAWWHGPDAEAIYRDVVKLHYSLIPYIFSTLVEAHLHGGPLLRNVNFEEESHQLGPDLFTKAITSDDGTVSFTLPPDGEWVDWRSGACYPGGTVISREYGLDEFPLFVRKGSVIPLRDGQDFKLLITPADRPIRTTLHLPEGEGTAYFDCTVRYNPSTGKLRLSAPDGKEKRIHPSWNNADRALASAILRDQTLEVVDSMGHALLRKGYNAGSGYNQTWIRDFNTFIETVLDEVEPADVRQALSYFFLMQQENGEILDGYVPEAEFDWDDDQTYTSAAAPGFIGFKNTVETDQETSLVQAVRKYVEQTGDRAFLEADMAGKSVLQRLEEAMKYLLREKLDPKYQLLTGALTADWGDVENDPVNCVDIGPGSTVTVDIYDNAMMVIALRDLASLDPARRDKWDSLRSSFEKNIRQYLWDSEKGRFIPHLYPEGKPADVNFDESLIYYHGGTAVAIEAGLLSRDEIRKVNENMLANVKASGMPSIGLTVYPTYPEGFFPGGMAHPYNYQNGGDWTWFGGRMIQQLVLNGFVAEAYEEIRPMLDRVIANGDFYEWYGPGGVPSGSAAFKGSAGVLCRAIGLLRQWAEEN